MSKSYTQFTDDERIEIYSMKQAGTSIADIAEALCRQRSATYREISRNTERDLL